ncbi:MAG TPA: GNAT family N-acetyltransferase [Longimicrobiaceae bacterium]|nr:GNAT family N-acetyltransferase [Longimicrobiaceae bacterium]
MRIVTLEPGDADAARQAARLLVDGFRDMAPEAWPTLDDALEEVAQACRPEKVALAAVGEDGTMLGWIGGQPVYDGECWELHPLVTHPAHRRRGIGRALVQALEAALSARGGGTLWLGTDDVLGLTSVGDVDLYPGVLERLRDLRDLRGHPFAFYQRLGYEIVGILPDANGFGKPDIFMAKRLPPPEPDG